MNLPDFKTNITGIVAISVLLLSYAILFSIIFWDFPSDQKDIYYSIAGVVGTLLSLVVSYYFGASKTETKHESSTQVEESKPSTDWENIN